MRAPLFSLLLAAAPLLACAESQSQNEAKAPMIGVTSYEEEVSGEASETDASAPTGTEEDSEPTEPTSTESLGERAEREHAERLDARALAALEAVESPDNDLGVVVAVVNRAADLPWTVAIENRGTEVVQMAALLSLLSFEVTPPQPESDEEGATQDEPKAIRCEANLPKSIPKSRRVQLSTGDFVTFDLDPRRLCDDPSVLIEGATVQALYGFPTQTKKTWKKGKLVEVDVEPTAPYAFIQDAKDPSPQEAAPEESASTGDSGAGAGDSSEEATPAPSTELKHVLARPFTLDETYPLEKVTPLATASDSAEASGSDGSEGDGSAAADKPKPIFEVSVKPLGKTSNPDGKTVTVRVKNVSGKSQKLFLRRELFVFEVLGPEGAATCRMHPAGRAPDASQFSTIGAGSSRTLTTRLPEACAKQTFEVSGSYSVFVRLEASNSGKRFGLEAFVGSVTSDKPARLEVTGGREPRQQQLQLGHR